MDMSLFRRAHMGATVRRAARIDYCVLVATLQAMQLATATARAEARCGAGSAVEEGPRQAAPLTEILLGRQDWQDAVLVQGGSFNPAFARGIDAL